MTIANDVLYRAEKGTPLTHNEMDTNLLLLAQGADTGIANAALAAAAAATAQSEVDALEIIVATKFSLVVDADGRTIITDENGTTYSNEGAIAIAPFILPSAAAGLEYSFIVQDADGIRVTAASGDTIQIVGSVSATAGKIESTEVGAVITLKAINATQWIATSIMGTWTVT